MHRHVLTWCLLLRKAANTAAVVAAPASVAVIDATATMNAAPPTPVLLLTWEGETVTQPTKTPTVPCLEVRALTSSLVMLHL